MIINQHRVSVSDRLFTSTHLELNAAIQDFRSSFRHCCIVTQMYYFQVFKAFGTRALLFWALTSHLERALRVPNQTSKACCNKWPNTHNMTSTWLSILVSTVSLVLSHERKAHVYQYWICEIGLVTAAYNKTVPSVINVNQTIKDRKALTALE